MHLGRLRGDGTRVAVKVQHPNLAHRLALDLTLLRKLADAAARLAPGLRIEDTVDQFACNFAMQVCGFSGHPWPFVTRCGLL